MKEIQTKSGDILCVEVPEDSDVEEIIDNLNLSGNNKYLGKLSELIDEDCEEFVELLPSNMYKNYKWPEDKVRLTGIQPINATAKESFISLLESEGIDTSREYLVIKVL